MTKRVIIIGGKGNGSVIANAINDANKKGFKEWVFTGFLNDHTSPGTRIENLPVLGSLQTCDEYIRNGYFFIYTIYRIDGQKERIQLFRSLNIPDSQLAVFIHPDTYISPDSVLKPGTVVMPGSIISSGVTIGRGSLLMPGSFVGHNTIIGDHCHLAARSCLSSMITTEEGVHIGLNATVRENLKIGKYSTLGMGSVLLSDIGTEEIWAGNPARFIRKVK